MKKYLISKIKHYEKQGHEFSHIRLMTITFITNLDQRKLNHFLQQPIPSLVRHFIKKFDRNPDLMELLPDTNLTLHMTLKRIIPDED